MLVFCKSSHGVLFLLEKSTVQIRRKFYMLRQQRLCISKDTHSLRKLVFIRVFGLLLSKILGNTNNRKILETPTRERFSKHQQQKDFRNTNNRKIFETPITERFSKHQQQIDFRNANNRKVFCSQTYLMGLL